MRATRAVGDTRICGAAALRAYMALRAAAPAMTAAQGCRRKHSVRACGLCCHRAFCHVHIQRLAATMDASRPRRGRSASWPAVLRWEAILLKPWLPPPSTSRRRSHCLPQIAPPTALLSAQPEQTRRRRGAWMQELLGSNITTPPASALDAGGPRAAVARLWPGSGQADTLK